jgi:hypothetical protein
LALIQLASSLLFSQNSAINQTLTSPPPLPPTPLRFHVSSKDRRSLWWSSLLQPINRCLYWRP